MIYGISPTDMHDHARSFLRFLLPRINSHLRTITAYGRPLPDTKAYGPALKAALDQLESPNDGTATDYQIEVLFHELQTAQVCAAGVSAHIWRLSERLLQAHYNPRKRRKATA